MDAKAKAEEFFETIVTRKKTLIEIPLNCSARRNWSLTVSNFCERWNNF